MEAILKQIRAVAEPTVIFSDIEDVCKVLASDGIPTGTYAVGTQCIKIKIVFCESESDHLQIAIRHEDHVFRLPLIKAGFKGCYSLCVCMPGCGPTDLKAFKVLWKKIHGYQLQQFEDEDGNRVKLVETSATAPQHNLRATGTSRYKKSNSSKESDSETPTEQSTDVPKAKEVLQSRHTDDVVDKKGPWSSDTSGGIAEKNDTADQPGQPVNNFEEECTSQENSPDNHVEVDAIDDNDNTEAGGPGQPLRSKCSKSKAAETAWTLISKSQINQMLSSLLPTCVPLMAESSITLEAKIGKGRFTVVQESRLRIVEKIDSMRTKTKLEGIESFSRQVWALSALKHPNVVSLMGVCLDKDRLELLTDYIDGGTLLDYLKGPTVGSLTTSELVGMCRQVATGMEYIAGKGWLHGELTSRNVLLTSTLECKIAGFGSATLATDIQQTVNYPHSYAAALEVHQNKEFTSKCDVWSFGILFMEVMSKGQTPYRGRVDPTQLKVYLEIGSRWKRPDCVSQEHYTLMQRCWRLKPRARPTFQQLVTELSK